MVAPRVDRSAGALRTLVLARILAGMDSTRKPAPLHPDVLNAIRKRARDLAHQAPPLSERRVDRLARALWAPTPRGASGSGAGSGPAGS